MERHAVSSNLSNPADGLPTFLTVEEAAAVLRIGRTAAYLLARQWEDSGGEEGLPVVRFGRTLRVPVQQLERIAAGEVRAKRTRTREATRSPRPAETASNHDPRQVTTTAVPEAS